MKSLQNLLETKIEENQIDENQEIQLDESVQSAIADATSHLSSEQIKYLATAVLTAVTVGGAISAEKIMKMLKSDKKIKAEELEKVEAAMKKA